MIFVSIVSRILIEMDGVHQNSSTHRTGNNKHVEGARIYTKVLRQKKY
ncbi:unnamed protein product [Acanthoscelides obtectus]|uniref:Uncharacterized protein n=1 Tax=Acanthoscelides obtectus TaxID=200917 RepID=A0A9P0PA26_ACAOB|nr:unnamed protein product [Acanthoscelides obtectus]CAK1677173.1 hypothetical protein AOBTE_LOCUS31161 [Acanthoscelides obtectus]